MSKLITAKTLLSVPEMGSQYVIQSKNNHNTCRKTKLRNGTLN